MEYWSIFFIHINSLQRSERCRPDGVIMAHIAAVIQTSGIFGCFYPAG